MGAAGNHRQQQDRPVQLGVDAEEDHQQRHRHMHQQLQRQHPALAESIGQPQDLRCDQRRRDRVHRGDQAGQPVRAAHRRDQQHRADTRHRHLQSRKGRRCGEPSGTGVAENPKVGAEHA
nr:hypothetical protein [Nakamurella aerolata]